MKTIGIIGFGRFGKLVSKIISEQLPEFDLMVFSRQQRPPKNSGVLSFASKTAISKCDVIIPCVSISAFKQVVKELKNDIKPGCLFIDVCSVKIFPITVMKEFLPKNVNIVASHPLFGPDSAKNGIKGLKIVLWNVRSKPKIFSKTKKILKKLGFKIIEMSPQEHDKLIAFSQVFTHLVCRMAERMDIKSGVIDTASFQQFLTLKQILINDNFELFLDMNKFNPFAVRMRKKFLQSFLKIERSIHE
ncbi:MAG TPA: prephenate dehydrogenase/arogenate dehydrogenase family protein [Patescibacteria group bacterium]|nr:prephenate dehydrogenase/arogenate dehydrogenase family protein [Patescibacteria group bacterium]